MQPVLGNFIQAFAGSVMELITDSSRADDTTLTADLTRPDTDSWQRTPSNRRAGSIQADLSPDLSHKKRGREGEAAAEQRERSSKRVRPNEDGAESLIESHPSGRSATVNATLLPNSSSDWIPAGRKSRMPSSTPRPFIKPVNTLDQPKFGGHRTRAVHASPSNNFQSSYRNGMSPSTSLPGARVQQSQTLYGSGFRDPDSRGMKKRKTNNGFSSPSQHFDLTNEDNEVLSRQNSGSISVNGREAKDASPRTATRPSPAVTRNPFDLNESRKLDHMMTPRTRRPRSSQDGHPMSHASTSSPPPEARIERADDLGSKVEACETKDKNAHHDSLAQVLRANHPQQQPKPDLTGDQLPFLAPPSKLDQDDILSLQGPSHQRKEKSHSGNDMHRPSPERLQGPRRTAQPSPVNAFYFSQTNNIEEEPKKSGSFRRDDGLSSPPPQKLKARQRMRSSTGPNPSESKFGRISAGSEDELNGATTISKRPPQAPPMTPVSNHREPLSKQNLASFTRERLHENAHRTNHRLPSTQHGHAHVPTIHPSTMPAKDAVRIPISAIFCRYCVLEGSDIALAWTKELNTFQVKRGGEIQMLHGQRLPVQIDARAVQRCVLSYETLQLQLIGSKTQCDNGRTLLAFEGEKSMNDFLDCLMIMTQDHLKIESMARERMEKIFARQSTELRSVFQPTAGTLSSIIGVRSPLAYNADRPTRLHNDEEESIKYEEENQTFPDNQDDGLVHVGTVRRSSRRSQPNSREVLKSPSPEKWTSTHDVPSWSHPLVYPASGLRRVTIDSQDIARLDEGEYLNDNLVSFALRQIEEGMDPRYKQDVHFFNSFFFSALSIKNGRKAFNYDAVKRWTRNTDLFTFPYVVVPINAEFHWFVAIICNLPSLHRKVSGLEDGIEDPGHGTLSNGNIGSPIEISENAPSATSPLVMIPSSDDAPHAEHQCAPTVTEIQKLDEEIAVEDKQQGKLEQVTERPVPLETLASRKVKRKPIGKKYSLDDTVIMTLDSLDTGRSPEVRYLKEYISAEAKDKREMDVEITQIQGITAKGIPTQSNFSDCGVYLVGYLEKFAKNPRKFVSRVLSREMEPADFVGFDPSAKRAELRDSLLELGQKQEEERKAQKAAKRAKKEAEAQARTESHAQVQGPAQPANLPYSSSAEKATPPITESDASMPAPQLNEVSLTD